MTCASLETIAGWALSELTEAEAELFEAHYFGCSTCFDRAERLLRLAGALRRALPYVLTAERCRALEGGQRELSTAHVQPGQKALIRLDSAKPVGIWYLHCDLKGVARVDLEGCSLAGDTLFQFQDVPFDFERGLVAMPCHLHYRASPVGPRFLARLSSPDAEAPRVLAEYVLDHEFENV